MRAASSSASSLSGISEEEAFKLDKLTPSLYERFGHDAFVQLSTDFYNRVYADEQKWFADIFTGHSKAEAIRNQYEFFIQRMGGPPLYSQRKGHPALIARHRPFLITKLGAERWLFHMRNAIESVDRIRSDPEGQEALLNFLTHTAFFIHIGNEMMRERERSRPC